MLGSSALQPNYVLQRTTGTFYVLTYHRGPAPLNTALGPMNEQLGRLNPVEEGMLLGRTLVIRKILDEANIKLGSAPFSSDVLDQAWEHIVVHPVDEQAVDWIVGSFGGLLIEHFRARFSFRPMELKDEYGASICLVEPRTGVRLFPFDTVRRRINEQSRRPFGALFSQIDSIMAQQGLAPHRSPA